MESDETEDGKLRVEDASAIVYGISSFEVKMAIIRSFRDLDVYVLGREHAKKIFLVSKAFPKEERYSLTD